MKAKMTLMLVLLVVFTGSMVSYPARSAVGPNLEILKISGISEEVGSFRCIQSTFMERANFYKQGMAFDSKGNLYIGDSGDCQIEVFDENLKPLRHFGSIGTGEGQFQYLVDLKIDEDQIFALDLILGRIQVFDLQGSYLYQFETGLPEDSQPSHPTGFAISKHEQVIVLDLFNDMIVFDRKGKFIRRVDGLINQFEAENNQIYIPIVDMKSDEAGNIYLLANMGGDGSPFIIILKPDLEISRESPPIIIPTSDRSVENGVFAIEGGYLYSAIWDPTNPYNPGLYSCMKMKYDLENPEELQEGDILQILDNDPSNQVGMEVLSPSALLVRHDILYFLDYTNKITKMNTKGEIVGSFKSPTSQWVDITGITEDNQGNLLVCDAGKKGIQVVNHDFESKGTIGSQGNPDLLPNMGELYKPYAIVQDLAGYLYCTDSWYNCIQVFSPDHQPYMTYYPPNRIEKATGLTIDAKGALHLIDGSRKVIYSLDISKIKEKKIILTQSTNDGKYAKHSLAVSQKGRFLVPVSDIGIIAELSSKGKVVKRGYDTFSSRDKDEFFLPTYIYQDKNQNFIVVDEWLGYFWKFDSKLNNSWSEKLNWFGIQSVWQSGDGTIYAVDRAHSLLIKMKDKSYEKSYSSKSLFQPDPKPNSIAKDSPVHAFGKALGISLNDTNSMVFPLENQESMVFFKSTMVTKRDTFATGIVRLDSQGQVLKSQLLDTGFEKAIQLRNGNFLVLGKADNFQKGKEGYTSKGELYLTLVDRDGTILQAKVLSTDYEYFVIAEVLLAAEREDDNFEVIVRAYMSDNPNHGSSDSYGKCIRISINWSKDSFSTTEMPVSKAQKYYYYGKQNIASLMKIQASEDDPKRDYQAGDYQMSVYDLTGKTMWTKIINMPETVSSNDDCYFFPLADGSFLIIKFIDKGDIYLTRLSQNSKVIWESKIDRTKNNRISWIHSATLLLNGDLVVDTTCYTDKKELWPTLVFDTQGNLKQTIAMNQKISLGYYQILPGPTSDLWLVGDTAWYSFGESSAFVFYLADGLKNPLFEESQIKFTVTKASIEMDTAPNGPDLPIQPIDFRATLSSRKAAIKPVLALTKDLWP